ncbi:MAG: YdcF family protein [Candidatus Blackburnbacteria bacterium]|nr:YdcF family protein [Candidatus Blackburnbacteria bacterium]
MGKTKINKLAKIIWEYHLMHMPLQKADCVFVLGSNDLRVAEWVAQLYLDGLAPFIIFSGFKGKLTEHWPLSEAETMAKVAKNMGVPEEKILIEDKATNTGENVIYTKKLLEEKRLDPQLFILVQKPYMERRTYATFEKQWPEKDFIVTSPPISYEDFPNEKISKDALINTLVGDLQRIKIYPEKGFQVPQEIPQDVWDAYEELVKLGYNKHLIQ